MFVTLTTSNYAMVYPVVSYQWIAIVNNQLNALGLAIDITPDMGHDRWANDVTLRNIHERSLFTSRFHLYKNTKVSMETP